MLLQLFISSVILCSIHSGQAKRCVYCNRTPQTLQIDFQDSCKDVLGASQTTVCGSAYNAFISAFAGQHPDAVKDRYIIITCMDGMYIVAYSYLALS